MNLEARMSSPVSAEAVWIETPYGQLFARRWFPAQLDSTRPVIVLFHDSLGCVALWRDFPEQLCARTGLQVVAYDRLGFGQSTPWPAPLPPSPPLPQQQQQQQQHEQRWQWQSCSGASLVGRQATLRGCDRTRLYPLPGPFGIAHAG